MTRRRFYAPASAFAPDGKSITLAVAEARHLRDVLRLKPGDEAFVFDGEGREFRCVVGFVGRGQKDATLTVLEAAPSARSESPFLLRVGIALLKGEKFDLVVQKLTELGVVQITPLITARADMRLRDAGDAERRTTRWQRLALEACKQSGRARIPTVENPITFATLIERDPVDPGEMRLMFAERGGSGLGRLSTDKSGTTKSGIALIGPEGGWDDEEISSATEAGWKVVTLGGRVMRSETAAIIVTGLLQHIYGDLR